MAPGRPKVPFTRPGHVLQQVLWGGVPVDRLLALVTLPGIGQNQEAAMQEHLNAGIKGDINRSAKGFIFSNINRPDTVVDLNCGQGWGVKGKRRQQTLLCLQGRVWVTQECDIRDYLLEAGDAFLITLPGLVLVRALTPARIGYAERLDPEPFKGRFSQTVFN